MKIFFAGTLLCAASIWQVSLAQVQALQKPHTESQLILTKVMEDIRHCDKNVRYEYDSKTRTISPPELKKIKGFKLKKLYREIAVFEIDESYEGMRAAVLLVGRAPQTYVLPIHSVAFRNSYKTVRERLEQRWHIPFKDATPPTTTYDGPSATFEMTVNGKWRELSIQKRPPEDYPHIPLPDVGCNHVAI